jgi:hypothetical protein
MAIARTAQYDANGFFDVAVDGGNRYRIHHGAAMNILEIDDVGGVRGGWGFIPRACLVGAMFMLAQKIAMETNEPGYRDRKLPLGFNHQSQSAWIPFADCVASFLI